MDLTESQKTEDFSDIGVEFVHTKISKGSEGCRPETLSKTVEKNSQPA